MDDNGTLIHKEIVVKIVQNFVSFEYNLPNAYNTQQQNKK